MDNIKTRRLPIESVDPIITNATDAVNQLAGALENATCLFKLVEEGLFERVVPDCGEASQLHAALMVGIETLRQHARVAYCIAETLERTA